MKPNNTPSCGSLVESSSELPICNTCVPPSSCLKKSDPSKLGPAIGLRLLSKRLQRKNPTVPEINSPATVTPTEIPTNAAVDSPDFSESIAGTSKNPVVSEWPDVVDACDVAAGASGDGVVRVGTDVDVPDGASNRETLKEAELAKGIFVLEE
ncbi:hypothetical protein ACHAQI_007509 [Fusarium lateritium]